MFLVFSDFGPIYQFSCSGFGLGVAIRIYALSLRHSIYSLVCTREL